MEGSLKLRSQKHFPYNLGFMEHSQYMERKIIRHLTDLVFKTIFLWQVWEIKELRRDGPSLADVESPK
jgi:hypothetical protein